MKSFFCRGGRIITTPRISLLINVLQNYKFLGNRIGNFIDKNFRLYLSGVDI